jgi:hypothetical protein
VADVDAVLQPSARTFYEEIATDAERAHIDDAIALIRLDHLPDNELKFPFNAGLPTAAYIYYDGLIWIIYRLLNNWTISILNIGFEEEIPGVRR